MIEQFRLFVYLIGPIIAMNAYRDKIRIQSCENRSSSEPEMTITAPAIMFDNEERIKYHQTGDDLEIVVHQNDLLMVSSDESIELQYKLQLKSDNQLRDDKRTP
jgi:hypothetical protein